MRHGQLLLAPVFSAAIFLSCLFASYANADDATFSLPGKYRAAPQTAWIDGRGRIGTNPAALAGTAKFPGILPVDRPAIWGESLLDGYQRALEENKPLILLFATSSCHWCNKMYYEPANVRTIENFSNCAVFVRVDPENDAGALAVKNGLEIRAYPSISVLAPNPDVVEESGRLIGYMQQKTFEQSIGKLLHAVFKTTGRYPDGCPVVAAK